MKVAILTTDNREHLRDYTATTPYFGTAAEALLQGFASLPEVEVHVVSCTQRPMQSLEKIAGNIWFHSLHVPKIGWMRTAYQGCIRATRKKLREINPDIVHGQGTERDCAISAVFSGFLNLLTIHGNMRLIAKVNRARPFSYQWLAARLERVTLPRTRGIVCISRYTQESVRDLARQTWVVPNATAKDFFDVKRALENEPVILCVGHVILRKNQNALIRALDALAARIPFQLRFLGQALSHDPYAAEFLELVRSRNWCQHRGFANRETLKRELASGRLLVMPSLEENCPMVLLEAMATGVPIVAARVGGVPDLIDENVNGIFCDPNDMESMREAVARALGDPQQAQRMAEIAKRRALERYHPTVVARRHLEIYGEVLS